MTMMNLILFFRYLFMSEKAYLREPLTQLERCSVKSVRFKQGCACPVHSVPGNEDILVETDKGLFRWDAFYGLHSPLGDPRSTTQGMAISREDVLSAIL